MGTPVEGPPSLGGHGAQQYTAYDPRSNGLIRQPTNPLDMQSAQNLSPGDRSTSLTRSPTDPGSQHLDAPPRDKPRTGRSGKICGKCGGGLTGQFVRALGDTYHLECFTCHVCTTSKLYLCVREIVISNLAPCRHPTRLKLTVCRIVARL